MGVHYTLNISKEFLIISQKNNAPKAQLCQIFAFHGLIYFELKDYIKSIEFYKKSLNYITDNKELSGIYKFLADAYIKVGEKDKALFYLNESLKVK